MANNQGGVIIWGVDARKTTTPDGFDVDAACGPKRIQKPLELKGKLLALRGDLTDPPVGGVEIAAIDDPAVPGEGFVACFIPESSFKPHRSNASGKQIYHLRTGDRFIVLPTALLRTMFYPHRTASFWIEGTLTCKEFNFPRESGFAFELKTQIGNCGNGTAADTCVLIQADARHWRHHELRPFPYWKQWGHPQGLYSLQTTIPIHPENSTILFTLLVNVERIIDTACPPFEVTVRIYGATKFPRQRDWCSTIGNREALQSGGCSRRVTAERIE